MIARSPRAPRSQLHVSAAPAAPPGKTAAIRRGIAPLHAKRIAARQAWRRACGCGQLLGESFEIAHVVPLCAGGANADDNLEARLRTHHQAESSEQSRVGLSQIRLGLSQSRVCLSQNIVRRSQTKV